MSLRMSRNQKLKINIAITSFVVFVIYCVLMISKNVPISSDKISVEKQYAVASQLPTVPHDGETLEALKTSTSNICKEDIVLRNTDPNHTAAHLDFWRHLNGSTIKVYKRRWQKFIANIRKTPIPIDKLNGRGIVFIAGNRDTVKRTLTTVKLLRNVYDCKLSIEIWHLHDEQPSADVRLSFEELGATFKDLSNPKLVKPIIKRRDADKQFQIKAAAIINSAFKEVLYLDSDNIPLKDPTFLFDLPEYKETGALFWPDYWKTHGENKIFDIMDIDCDNEWEQESGQMVIDKEKSWVPLQLAWYMQKHYEIYFQFLNGDKDTFKYAWKALHSPYHMVEVFPGMAGTETNGRFCGHTILQYVPFADDAEEDDDLIFVHANLLKITDKKHFIRPDGSEHPWDLLKRSSLAHTNTYIKPEFYISNKGQACMDFTHREGEPDAITEDFDQTLTGFQTLYFKNGGIGGETRA
ncbi:mannosyltransferase putative-domain-containing protein [Mycotypha africana]|uniref:mannosyltransferase putative-domain-containing protein n=1 Tax=Mycotypha africana TaxID=64632 RepID=UPI0023019894|nr:mannosyltransferase putative-domain-containing protein [Mycotypha africana]KAI8968158.1 mannosyltransferase putative-domain-containing protein [Mycotypha africana]